MTYATTEQRSEQAQVHSTNSLRNALVVAHLKGLRTGAILVVVGIIITSVTYSSASEGGTYVVAYGPVIFGAFRILKAFVGIAKALVTGS